MMYTNLHALIDEASSHYISFWIIKSAVVDENVVACAQMKANEKKFLFFADKEKILCPFFFHS
jgi:hypothetical protein